MRERVRNTTSSSLRDIYDKERGREREKPVRENIFLIENKITFWYFVLEIKSCLVVYRGKNTQVFTLSHD